MLPATTANDKYVRLRAEAHHQTHPQGMQRLPGGSITALPLVAGVLCEGVSGQSGWASEVQVENDRTSKAYYRTGSFPVLLTCTKSQCMQLTVDLRQSLDAHP